MGSPKFRVGDIVDVLPYDDVESHWGIHKAGWDAAVRSNPHSVISVCPPGTPTYNFTGLSGDFYWPEFALACVLPVDLSVMDDLL